MGKERCRNVLVPFVKLICCSSCVKLTDLEEDPVLEHLRNLDEQTLRDFEDSIAVNGGFLYLTGIKLKKYESRLRQLEESLLRTVHLPLDSPREYQSEMSDSQPALLLQIEAKRGSPSGQQMVALGEDSNSSGAGSASKEMRVAREARHKTVRRGALGDLSFLPVPSCQRCRNGCSWSRRFSRNKLTRTRSLGDLRKISFVTPQETSKGLARLEATSAAWVPSLLLTRSRSFDDLLDELSVRPQSAGAGLNRLETLFSIWSLPQVRREDSVDGLSSRVIPCVTPLHQSGGLNRLETNVWVWSNPATKKGSKRALRSRKLLRLRSPAPKRFRTTVKTVMRDSSPVWVSSSDFDSEAALSSSRESMSPSSAVVDHRRRHHGWLFESIVEYESSNTGKHQRSQYGWNSQMQLAGHSKFPHNRMVDGRGGRDVMISTRQLYAACERGGAGWDEDAVTRLVTEEPSSRFIIREKKPST